MSAEGIGMGGVAGAGGIATGSGIGTAAGISAGGGIGFEGGSIGIGSLGPSASVGIAEIGAAPSFSTAFSEIGSSVSPSAISEVSNASISPFSMDTSMPVTEAPFQMSNYQVLWSANSTQDISPVPTFGQPFEISVSTINSTPSDAMNADDMFADISNFMSQNPAVSETPQSMFSDIDTFLRNDTEVSPKIEGSIVETEKPQDASLSAVEQASLLGLMTRIEHFAPVKETAATNEHETDVSVDSTSLLSIPVEIKPAAFDFVAEATEQLSTDLDTSVTEEIKKFEHTLTTTEAVKEVQGIDYEAANPAPAVSVSSETGSTEEGKEIAIVMSQEEIEADREQTTRVLGIIEELKKDMDIADAPALAMIAESITNKVASGVSGKTVPAEATPRPEPMVGQAYSEVQQEQTEEVAVSAEAESEAQVIADTRGTGTEEVIIVNAEEEEELDKKMKPPQPTSVELGQDHRKNQYRTDRIVEAVKEVKENAEERFAKQGIIIDVTEVEGDAVADRLSYLQADDDAISEIVPEDEKDGSIAVLLHQMRDETFQTSADYDKAQVLSLQNTAVKEGKPPATKPEIEKVLFIANQHNQQVAA